MQIRNGSHFRQRGGNLLLALLALAAIAPSCAGRGQTDERPLVVATTTILGDVVTNVTGDAARVEVLMPRNADPHDFEPSSRQAALLAGADLVVANGLGLEEGLEDVLESVAGDGVRVLEVASELDPLPFSVEAGDPDDHDDLDPHVWLDPLRMADVARLVARNLHDSHPSSDWSSRAEAYAEELETAHRRISDTLSTIPPDRRRLVTNHDALGYLAARYGFEVVGVVIPGGSTLAEPGSEELAALVELIDAEGIRAIFADTTEPTALADAIAGEADHLVRVVVLHTGSLGAPGTAADTLIRMLEENARLIAEALG
ncbi:MAG TPA: metal ABC transporter substrate-binding protein [Acidimicrobiia bacterium]|nr:metal ABC transporter substrate-binding protein [Acidimicrobiia bacterium]